MDLVPNSFLVLEFLLTLDVVIPLPTWLEKKYIQLEAKLQKYEFQAKSDQTGVFKKVWIKIKSFVVKIIQLITKALAKVHRFVKNKYYDYKIEKQSKAVERERALNRPR